MKIENKKNKKITLILCLMLVLCAAGLGLFIFLNTAQNVPPKGSISDREIGDIDYSVPREDEATTPTTEQQKPDESTTTTKPSAEPIRLIISAKNQTESTLQVRTLIQELLVDGSCRLTLTKDNISFEKVATLFTSASSSTCQGFDVPLTELSSGLWKMNIVVTSGERSGTISTEVEIR